MKDRIKKLVSEALNELTGREAAKNDITSDNKKFRDSNLANHQQKDNWDEPKITDTFNKKSGELNKKLHKEYPDLNGYKDNIKNVKKVEEIGGIKGIPSLRVLTRKSKFGFGKMKDLTMQEILNLGKKKELISTYYKLSSINFIDDILEELGIVDEWVIEKPGTDKELFVKFLIDGGAVRKDRNRTGPNALKKERPILTKSQLQNKNQGR